MFVWTFSICQWLNCVGSKVLVLTDIDISDTVGETIKLILVIVDFTCNWILSQMYGIVLVIIDQNAQIQTSCQHDNKWYQTTN